MKKIILCAWFTVAVMAVSAQDVSRPWLAHVESLLGKPSAAAEQYGYIKSQSHEKTLINKVGTRGLKLDDQGIVEYGFCAWAAMEDENVRSLIRKVTAVAGKALAPAAQDAFVNAVWNYHGLPISVTFDKGDGRLALQFGRPVSLGISDNQWELTRTGKAALDVPAAAPLVVQKNEPAPPPPPQDPVVKWGTDTNLSPVLLEAYTMIKDQIAEPNDPLEISLAEDTLKILYNNNKTVYIAADKYYLHTDNSVKIFTLSGTLLHETSKDIQDKEISDVTSKVKRKYKLKDVSWELDYGIDGSPQLKGSNGLLITKDNGQWIAIDKDGEPYPIK